MKIVLALFVLTTLEAQAIERIYKSEARVWLNSEVEYGCEVLDSKDFMSFGFDSKFLPGVTLVYWKYVGRDSSHCDEYKCPKNYEFSWSKRFYKTDFKNSSVHFNGMSLDLKWANDEESYLGELRFMETTPASLRVHNSRLAKQYSLQCDQPKEQKKPEALASIIKAWKIELCEKDEEEKKNPRLSGPSIIGGGGALGSMHPPKNLKSQHPSLSK